MTTFSAGPTNLTVLLPQSCDCSSYVSTQTYTYTTSDGTKILIYRHTTSRTLSTCDVRPGSLTLLASEAVDLVELILLYIEIGLEVNAGKTKYMLKSPDQNA